MESFGWHTRWVFEKYRVTEKGLHVPDNCLADAMVHLDKYDEVVVEGNVLVYGGASVLFDRLTESSPTIGVFDQSNTMIGVGTSSTAADPSQTALQATNDSSNRHFIAQETSFPAHTDGTSSSAASIQFKSSFGTSAANFTWREFGVGRGTAGAGGTGSFSRMLNRKVQNIGTKTSADTWVPTVTCTLS